MAGVGGSWDVLVVGGGIAGLSLAAAVSTDRRVAVLEKESSLAAHTTGRSVATFIQSYGNATIQALNAASLTFFESARGRDGEPFARPLPFLYAATAATTSYLEAIYDAARAHAREMRFLDADLAVDFCPLLRRDWVTRGLVDPAVWDIDVHALMQDHAASVRAAGGVIRTGTEVVSARYDDGWEATDQNGIRYRAKILVNAANAWADTVAQRCGARSLGVRAMKRSVFTLPIPEGASAIPMVNAADEEFYFKPDAGQLLCSPADETPVDAGSRGAEQPDEYEIARAAAALDDATVLDTRYIHASWAGLRCFTDDRTPLVGWDRHVPRLFWHTALGGYGIQTSPALSRLGAALLRDDADADDAALDLAEALSPARLSA